MYCFSLFSFIIIPVHFLRFRSDKSVTDGCVHNVQMGKISLLIMELYQSSVRNATVLAGGNERKTKARVLGNIITVQFESENGISHLGIFVIW